MHKRRRVAVLLGGRSLEHDVSVVSGLQILHALDPDECEAIPVYIDSVGRWWTGEELWDSRTLTRGGSGTSRLTEVVLGGHYGRPALLSARSRADHGVIDMFIPVLHGTYGEDGSLQGALELRGAAYVGSGVTASALGMSKRLTKVVAASCGVPMTPWLAADRTILTAFDGWMSSTTAALDAGFGWPVIVKPNNLGSSAGVSVADNPDALLASVLRVFEYDTEVLIEPFIKNRLELNVAVAGLDVAVASVAEMPITQTDTPLSFTEKYKKPGRKSVGTSEGMASALRVLDPGDLPSAMKQEAQAHALRVFTALGCEGIARIDFLINTETDTLLFNEINTVPGSLAFYLWSAAPHYWTLTELLSRLMDRADHLRAGKMSLQREPPPELRLLDRP